MTDARDSAHRLLEQTARVADPARRLDLVKNLLPGAKSSLAGEREQLAARLRALGSLLRDVGVLATGGDRRVLANADLAAQLGPLTQRFDSERSTRAYLAVDQALVALERNANPKIVADWLVLQL